jgi:hypothetical protein
MPGHDEGLRAENILTTKRIRKQKGRPKTPPVPLSASTQTDPSPNTPPPPPPPVRENVRVTTEDEFFHFSDTHSEPDASQTNQPSVATPEKARMAKDHPHRLFLRGRPTEGCAADSRHFSASSSLVYTFMLLSELKEGPDGEFESAQLQCCICACDGDQAGSYRVTRKSKRSTGNYLNHFRSAHHDWWTGVEEDDKAVLEHGHGLKNYPKSQAEEVSI